MTAAFALVEDYAQRYGQPSDPDLVAVRLSDASALVRSMLPDRGAMELAEMADILRMTVCAMVERSIGADGFGGVSDYSESGIGLSASVKFANPHGDLYLTSTEKAALGIGGGSVGVYDPWQVAR